MALSMLMGAIGPRGRSGPGTTLRTSHGADLAARAAAAVKKILAVGFETADADAARHREPLEHYTALRVDPAQLAFVAFPGAVPQLAVDPRHAGDESVGFDGAQDLA